MFPIKHNFMHLILLIQSMLTYDHISKRKHSFIVELSFINATLLCTDLLASNLFPSYFTQEHIRQRAVTKLEFMK